MRRFTNNYNADGKQKRREARESVGNKCVRCGSPSVPGKILTTHHFDGDKSNDEWWNLLPLCQVCHLKVQAKVDPEIPWMLEHSEWIKPYVAGFLAHKYLGLKLEKYKVILFLDELTTLESRACKKDFGQYLQALRQEILNSDLPCKKGSGQVLLKEVQSGCNAELGKRKISGSGLHQNVPQQKTETGASGNNGGDFRQNA